MLRRDFVVLSTTTVLGAPLAVRAQAADRGWRLVVGFPPGTGPDVVARTLAQKVKGGKMVALATTAATRSALLPEVPSFTEAGFPKMDVSAWFALFVPASTPDAQQDALARQVATALQAPEVRQTLQQAGFNVIGSSRADAQRMVRAETARWAGIVKASGFKGD